jgi:PleD family two-component response regulator
MQLLDPQIGDCRALVIDGNPTSRSTQVAMLRDWGVGTVAQTSRPADALRILEERMFDVVLCDSTSTIGAWTARACSTSCAATTCCPTPPCSSW